MQANRAEQPVNVADYERLASEKLAAGVHGYFAGGAGDERTLRENVAAYAGWRLRPRVMVDVSRVTTEVSVLGAEASSPALVAPVAFQRLVDPEGEVAMARAAASEGTVMCLSTLASARPAELAGIAGRRWFQLYCFRDREVTRALLDEAIDSGFEAIVLTVDAPRAGRRERDFRTGFEIPPEIGVPSIQAAIGADRAVSVQEAFSLVDPGLTWDELERLRNDCALPILVKGLMTAEDAVLASTHGADAVIVSNHGGRQLDGVEATINVLEEVVEALGDRTEILIDGGIRRGTDIAVALALGARAVLIGRPVLWGLAWGGEEGARQVLEVLRSELELALALLGCTSPDELGRGHVARAVA